MKKNFAILILSLCLFACHKHADSSQVHLENGTPGLLVHCNGLTEDQCLADVCKNGGEILHRNVSNVSDSYLVSCK